MRIKVDRINLTKNTTLGTFSINDDFQCYTLEDTYHKIKIPGVTRIPPGEYEIVTRPFGGMYDLYSGRFQEDHPMLWLQNVPGFEYIYIHILNYHTETEGCIGVGRDFIASQTGDYSLLESEKAYKEIYYPIKSAIFNGELVTIRVGDSIAKKRPKLKIPDSLERKKLKLEDKEVTISTLERMWHDLDSKAVIMGSMNFVTARLTGYRWFKNKIKVKEDQSPLGRLIELLIELIKKMKGSGQ